MMPKVKRKRLTKKERIAKARGRREAVVTLDARALPGLARKPRGQLRLQRCSCLDAAASRRRQGASHPLAGASPPCLRDPPAPGARGIILGRGFGIDRLRVAQACPRSPWLQVRGRPWPDRSTSRQSRREGASLRLRLKAHSYCANTSTPDRSHVIAADPTFLRKESQGLSRFKTTTVQNHATQILWLEPGAPEHLLSKDTYQDGTVSPKPGRRDKGPLARS